MNSITKQYLLTFSVTALLHAVCFGCFDIYYNTNDDVGMALVAKGYFTGSPNEHLIFLNTVLGYVLKFMYETFPNVEWYSVLLVGLQFFAIATIARILHPRTSLVSRLAFWVAAAYFVMNLQFTNVAYLALSAGLLVFFTRRKQAPWWQFGVGILFILTAFLIRIDATVVGIFICLPFLLRKDKRFIASAAVLFLLICVSFAIHLKSYSSPSWRYFQEYNLVRGALNDNPNMADFAQNPEALKKVGITSSELELFNNSTPPENFNLELLKKIYDEVKFPSLKRYLTTIFLSYSAFLLFLSLLLVAFYNRSQYNKVKISLLLFCIIDLIICLNHYPKERVTFDLLFLIFLFALIASRGFSKKPLQLASGIVLLFFGVMTTLFVSKINPKLEFIAPPENNVIPLFSDYRTYFGRVKPFDMPKNSDKKVMAASWLVNSPVQQKQYELSGISIEDHFSPFLNKQIQDKMLFLGDTTSASLRFVEGPVKMYLQSKNLKVVQVKQTDSFLLYQISAKNDTVQ